MGPEIFLVNFATTKDDVGCHNYEPFQERLNNSARQFGIQNIVSWNRQLLLKTDFYEDNKWILDQMKGAGYWLWKPFIINMLLKEVAESDIVFYVDASMRFISDPSPLFDLCITNGGFFLVEIRRPGRKNRYYTKRDCFHFMELDTSFYHDNFSSGAGVQLYQKNDRTLEFVDEYLFYCRKRHILTDGPNVCGKPDLDGFKEHRHDQAVLSLLRLKYRIQGFRWPTQWGVHDTSATRRTEGEWLCEPDAEDLYLDSPYGILWDG